MTGPPREQGLSEEQLDTLAGLVLIVGSTLGVICMAIGFVVSAVRPLPSETLARPPSEVLSGVAQLDPLAVMNLGILVLMATPVLRVIIAAVGFALQRRWRFVGVSVLVFALLMLSFFVASR